MVAPGNLGMEIGYPNDWMHLLYVFVSPNADLRHQQVEGPDLAGKLFIDSKAHPELTIGSLDEPIDFECGTVFPAGWHAPSMQSGTSISILFAIITPASISRLTSDSKALQVRLLHIHPSRLPSRHREQGCAMTAHLAEVTTSKGITAKVISN